MYKLTSDENVVQKTDINGIVSFVPNDSANRDWQDYQAWLADGNTPDPAE